MTKDEFRFTVLNHEGTVLDEWVQFTKFTQDELFEVLSWDRAVFHDTVGNLHGFLLKNVSTIKIERVR